MAVDHTAQEIDPFVKRVVTIKESDNAIVIFRIVREIDPKKFDQIKEYLESKMGPIPFLVIGPDFDLTVLKRPDPEAQQHQGMLIA